MTTPMKILLSVAVVAAGGGLLIYSSLAKADYYKHVHEVTSEPDTWTDKSLKVHGFVEAGSIQESIQGNETVRLFVLEYEGQRLTVRHKGPKPDTFKDLAEVVAQGRLVREGDGYVLVASNLMAKCPSKYEEGKRARIPAGGQAAQTDGQTPTGPTATGR